MGDCEIKIGEEELKLIREKVNWSSPDAHRQATALLRKRAFEYVESYRRGGNTELAVYRDKKRPTFIAKEFRGLLENSPYPAFPI